MTNEIAKNDIRKSVVQDMADKFNMEREAFEAVIKQTVMPAKVAVKNEEFVAFLSVAKEYGLNPLTKEVYAFPAKGGGIMPIVSIDGWARIINDHDQYDGAQFEDIVEDGKIVAIKCTMYRKDRSQPINVTEYLSECSRPTEPWNKWPARMLRHKALIQAARYAFGFSGIYDKDEAERINEVKDVTPKKEPKTMDLEDLVNENGGE